MGYGWGLLFFAAGLAAAQQAPLGIVRGTLIARDQTETGELTVRLADNHVYFFQFDARTLVEKEKKTVAVTGLATGDKLEIVSDVGKNPRERYARTVKVVTEEPASPPRRVWLRRHPPEGGSMLDDLFPRGNMTFAGVVASVGRDSLLLRTRGRNETRILLRPDTRYLREGQPVEAAALAVNTRVFVRAGKNLYEEIEAYQVIWGEILKPD
jgi:hypothetical protein